MNLRLLITSSFLLLVIVKKGRGQQCPFESVYRSSAGDLEEGGYMATVNISNTTCRFSVEVRDPVVCPGDVIRLASANTASIPVWWTMPAYSNDTLLGSSLSPGSEFPVGETTRVWYFTGDIASQCSFNVTINYPDCPSDVVIPLSEAAGVNWTEPAPVDGYTIQSEGQPAVIETAGVYPVSYTFSQNCSAGASCSPVANCTFNIIVYENAPPVIIACPVEVIQITVAILQDVPAFSEPGTKNLSLGDELVSDSREGALYSYTEGDNLLNFTYMNKHSNLSSTCMFRVFVALKKNKTQSTPPGFLTTPSTRPSLRSRGDRNSGLETALVLIAAAGYILWVITMVIVCITCYFKTRRPSSGTRRNVNNLPRHPPPTNPAPFPQDQQRSEGIYDRQGTNHSSMHGPGHNPSFRMETNLGIQYDRTRDRPRIHPSEEPDPDSGSEPYDPTDLVRNDPDPVRDDVFDLSPADSSTRPRSNVDDITKLLNLKLVFPQGRKSAAEHKQETEENGFYDEVDQPTSYEIGEEPDSDPGSQPYDPTDLVRDEPDPVRGDVYDSSPAESSTPPRSSVDHIAKFLDLKLVFPPGGNSSAEHNQETKDKDYPENKDDVYDDVDEINVV